MSRRLLPVPPPPPLLLSPLPCVKILPLESLVIVHTIAPMRIRAACCSPTCSLIRPRAPPPPSLPLSAVCHRMHRRLHKSTSIILYCVIYILSHAPPRTRTPAPCTPHSPAPPRTRFRSSISIHAPVYSFTMHIYRAPGALRSSPPITFSPTFRSATASVYLGRKGLYTSNPSRSLVCLCVSDTVFLPVSRSAPVVCLLCSNCFMYCTIAVTCCPRRPSSALCIHHFTRSLARPFVLSSVRSTPQSVHRKPPIACCAPVVDRWPSGHLSTLLALSPRCLPRA